MPTAQSIQTAVYDGTQDEALALNGFDGNFEYRIEALPRPAGDVTFSVWARAPEGMEVSIIALGESFTRTVTAEWTRLKMAFVNDGSGSDILIRPGSGGTLYLYKAQLEAASAPSDWRAAPEDEQRQIADNRAEMEAKTDAMIAELAETSALANNVGDLARQALDRADANGNGLVNIELLVQASVQQLKDSITNNFVQAIRYVDDTAAPTAEYVELARSYQRFDANGIELGRSNSPFKVNLSNEELAFSENGEKVAYINNRTMHITDAEVENGLKIGLFEFRPTDTGMALVYTG